MFESLQKSSVCIPVVQETAALSSHNIWETILSAIMFTAVQGKWGRKCMQSFSYVDQVILLLICVTLGIYFGMGKVGSTFTGYQIGGK